MNNEFSLKLTLEEMNTVLNSLGNLSFKQVHELIRTIQTQAATQIQEQANATSPAPAKAGVEKKDAKK